MTNFFKDFANTIKDFAFNLKHGDNAMKKAAAADLIAYGLATLTLTAITVCIPLAVYCIMGIY